MEGFIALASFSLAYAFIVLLGLILLLNILGLPANWVVVLLVVLVAEKRSALDNAVLAVWKVVSALFSVP